MKKYNTQKRSLGRTNNERNKKDLFTQLNHTYPLFEMEEVNFYMDSVFKKDFFGNDKEYKSIYVSRNDEDKIRLCLIDKTVAIDCDFMEHIKDVYRLSLEKVIMEDIHTEDGYNRVYTNITPSSYNASSTSVSEIDNIEGFYFEKSVYDLFRRHDYSWTVSGHSEAMHEEETESLDLEKIRKMDSLEFYLYFRTLVID